MKQYYKVEKTEQGWKLLNPAGKEFYSLGVDCVTVVDVDFDNFEEVIGKGGSSFGTWSDKKLEDIGTLGFNTLGSWHHMYYWGNGFPKTVELSLSKYARKVNTVWGVGFPDVFDDSFRVSIHKVLIDCFFGKGAVLREDEGLIGYYTDNELHWWGSGGYWGDDDQGRGSDSTGLVDDYIQLEPDKAGKKAWVNFIKERYGTVDALNEAWDSEYSSLDDLSYIQHYRARPEVIRQDKLEFLKEVARVYFETTSSLLKQYDPNHLNLGCRMVGNSTPDVVFEVMGEYVDVNSMNFYNMNFPDAYLKHVTELTGKPVMITEFSFCAGREAGFLYNTNGARNVLVKDQTRRGESYARFVLEAARQPYMVGTHWFALYDYANNVHGLIGNYGLYDTKDSLWKDFGRIVAETNFTILQDKRRG